MSRRNSYSSFAIWSSCLRTSSPNTPAAISLRALPVEEAYGWRKTVALLRKTRHRAWSRGGWMVAFAAAAYNLFTCGGA